MKDFRDLNVWRKAHGFAVGAYEATRKFPKEEIYGLTSQIRRASVSMPANIAEGCGRSGDPELARFLQIAMGSASEVEYLLLLAHDLGILERATHRRLDSDVTEIKRMLASFLKKLRADR